MPIVEITYNPRSVTESELRSLGKILGNVVSEAVDCPEEPRLGPFAVGDMNIFFRPAGPLDTTDLDCIVEVRTKLYRSRIEDRDERARLIRDRVARALPERHVGVWLVLAEGAWTQT